MAAEKVVVTKSKLDNLAEIISSKSEEPIPLTIDEMSAAVLDLNLVNNQNNITVAPTVSEQIITPESPYTGLDSVTVEAISPVRSQEDLTTNGPYVDVPKGWYPRSVWGQVGPGSLETPSFTRTNYTDHVVLTPTASVSQSGYIWATSSTGTSVTISASNVTNGTKSITQNGTFDVTNYKNASVNVPAPTPTALTVTPTKEQQNFSDGTYNPVTVNAIPSQYIIPVYQSKTVTPTESQQTVSPDLGYNGLNKVTVNAIPSQYIIPSGTVSVTQNGTVDVTSYANANVNVDLPTSGEQIVTPTKNTQIITGDNAIVASLPIKTLNRPQASTRLCTYSQIGAYLSNMVVGESYSVDAYINDTYNNHKIYISGTFVYDFGSSSDATLYITNIGTVTQDADFYDFYASNPVELIKWRNGEIDFGLVFNGSAPSSISMGTGSYIRFLKDTDLLSQVTVEPIPDEYVIPTLQSKTITPTESQQTVSPDSGYDGLDEVTVSAISSTYVGTGITRRSSSDLTSSGSNVSVPAGYYAEQASKQVNLSVLPTSLSSSPKSTATNVINISPSETIRYLNINSGYITGTDKYYTINPVSSYYVGSSVAKRSSTDLTASGATVTVPAGYYSSTSSKSVATGSLNNPSGSLDAATGKITMTSSVRVAGYISGDATTSTPMQLPTKPASTIVPKTFNIVIPSGYYLTGVQTITGDSNLIAENIKKDIGIFGVTGTYEGTVINNQDKSFTPDETGSIITPDEGYTGLGSVTVDAIPSTYVGSGITRRSSSDLTAPLATVNVPAGYYAEDASKTISNGSVTVTTAKGNVVSNSVKVFGRVTYTQGFISSGSENDSTGIIIHASDLVSGNKAITQNGTGIDVTNYATVSVNVQPTLQSKTVTPTESSQTITPDTGYDGLDEVTVNAISPTYIGSDITQRSSTDLTASGATVTVPAGYYSTQATKSVASGSATTPATSITANPTISVSSSGLITASVSASQNVTPTVSAGYVSSGTAGTVSVSGSKTQQLTTKAAATITPGTTNQTIAAGTYLTGTQTIAGDADLVAGNIKAGVQIFGVTGNLSFITYYTGSSDPSSSLGSNGDIYLKVA